VTVGAKVHSWPVTRISSAVAAPIRSISAGIVRRAEADVVREDRRADDVRVAVHRVGAPDHRDADAAVGGVDRGGVERVGRLEPLRRGREVVAAGPLLPPLSTEPRL
jgi:hypothetical protein